MSHNEELAERLEVVIESLEVVMNYEGQGLVNISDIMRNNCKKIRQVQDELRSNSQRLSK